MHTQEVKIASHIAWLMKTSLHFAVLCSIVMVTIRVSDVNKDWTGPRRTRTRTRSLDQEPLMMTNTDLQHNRYRQLDLQ